MFALVQETLYPREYAYCVWNKFLSIWNKIWNILSYFYSHFREYSWNILPDWPRLKCNRDMEFLRWHSLLLKNQPSLHFLHCCSGSKLGLQLQVPFDLSHPLLPLMVLFPSQTHSESRVIKLRLISNYDKGLMVAQ